MQAVNVILNGVEKKRGGLLLEDYMMKEGKKHLHLCNSMGLVVI